MLNRYALTDPEFAERAQRFACEEVACDSEAALDGDTRHLAILAALVGSQSKEVYREMLPLALDAGLSPVAVKEMVYQAVDYLGLGRALPFLDITNEVFALRGIALPLEGQATTTMDDRLEKGAQAQAEIFGEQMLEAWKAGTVNRWLAANCFGDYYTRGGLDLKARELITFCFLAAQGGYEPRQRQGFSAPRRAADPAIHRLPTQPERHHLREQSSRSIKITATSFHIGTASPLFL